MPKQKTALGIDISQGAIHLALLKHSKDGIKLLKTASGPVPEQAIVNGNVENAAILAKAIKKLKAQNKITAGKTAMSLLARPTLMQIIDLPTHLPANIREFVRDRLKDYAILPVQKITMDFCGLKSPGPSPGRRVFVVAASTPKINDITRAMSRLNIDLDAIEPAETAYFRALYQKKIAKYTDCNQLFAIIEADTFTLCLFRNQTLDFVRTKRFESDTNAKDYSKWLAEEIRAIIQYYELEVDDNCTRWKLTLLSDASHRPVDKHIQSLRAEIESMEVEFQTPADAYRDTPLSHIENAQKPSAIAIGLAMKLLDAAADTPNINLLPEKTVKAKAAHKQTLGILNSAAIVMLLMILSINFFRTKEDRIDENRIRQEQAKLTGDTQLLLDEQMSLNRKITGISKELSNMKTVLGNTPLFKWGEILSDIGHAIPRKVQITNAFCGDNLNVLLEGWAISYEALYDFVARLEKSEQIESASLITTANKTSTDDLVRYSINCSLARHKGPE